MNGAVEIDEVIADVVAYFTAVDLEDTEDPSEDAFMVAHLVLSYKGLAEDTEEYATIFGTVYALYQMGYLSISGLEI